MLDRYTWVCRVDQQGKETIYAGLDQNEEAVWIRDLRLGELILAAAGVR